MSYAGAGCMMVTFVVLLRVLGVAERSRRVLAISRRAFEDFRSSELDDDAKEEAMQAHAKVLGALFVVLTLSVAVCVTAPLAVIWLLDLATVLSFDEVLTAALTWQLIAGGTLLAVALAWLDNRPHR